MATATRGLDFKPLRRADIPRKGSSARGSRYAATIGEFMRCGAEAVEIECDHRNPHAVANQLNAAVRRLGLDVLVTALIRDGRVFLERLAP